MSLVILKKYGDTQTDGQNIWNHREMVRHTSLEVESRPCKTTMAAVRTSGRGI
jgi:hypothetical protein